MRACLPKTLNFNLHTPITPPPNPPPKKWKHIVREYYQGGYQKLNIREANVPIPLPMECAKQLGKQQV